MHVCSIARRGFVRRVKVPTSECCGGLLLKLSYSSSLECGRWNISGVSLRLKNSFNSICGILTVYCITSQQLPCLGQGTTVSSPDIYVRLINWWKIWFYKPRRLYRSKAEWTAVWYVDSGSEITQPLWCICVNWLQNWHRRWQICYLMLSWYSEVQVSSNRSEVWEAFCHRGGYWGGVVPPHTR